MEIKDPDFIVGCDIFDIDRKQSRQDRAVEANAIKKWKMQSVISSTVDQYLARSTGDIASCDPKTAMRALQDLGVAWDTDFG
ncbi:hypothetical protein [Burkholderia sp. IDO3]|uniref:hypothetical protein n=1 Tax=Burkholderia sp. IDO3 TaxID=1705310 RepID=UPI0011777445|nr:hypothetical protein [Burkholderia sp. IDO3]